MKDALLLVFANKQDLSGGVYSPYPAHWPSLTRPSHATKGGLGPPAARKDCQGPCMESRAQLRHHRRGHL
jgi:hypothetical protein